WRGGRGGGRVKAWAGLRGGKPGCWKGPRRLGAARGPAGASGWGNVCTTIGGAVAGSCCARHSLPARATTRALTTANHAVMRTIGLSLAKLLHRALINSVSIAKHTRFVNPNFIRQGSSGHPANSEHRGTGPSPIFAQSVTFPSLPGIPE